MPFLHWDLDYRRTAREAIAKDAPRTDDSKRNNEKSSLDSCIINDLKWNSEEKLLNAYLVGDRPPLHLRRTLDQYYYHTLQDTTKRDGDQVVTRYQKKKLPAAEGNYYGRSAMALGA